MLMTAQGRYEIKIIYSNLWNPRNIYVYAYVLMYIVEKIDVHVCTYVFVYIDMYV